MSTMFSQPVSRENKKIHNQPYHVSHSLSLEQAHTPSIWVCTFALINSPLCCLLFALLLNSFLRNRTRIWSLDLHALQSFILLLNSFCRVREETFWKYHCSNIIGLLAFLVYTALFSSSIFPLAPFSGYNADYPSVDNGYFLISFCSNIREDFSHHGIKNFIPWLSVI